MSREHIGARLRRLRVEQNLSQETVAHKVRCDQKTLTNWELGRNMPRLDVAADLARMLGVSLDYLAGVTETR